jgi:hypothetical protein
MRDEELTGDGVEYLASADKGPHRAHSVEQGASGNGVPVSNVSMPFFCVASLPLQLCVDRVQSRKTALHVAAMQGHATVARLLLQHGADPTILDEVCGSLQSV